MSILRSIPFGSCNHPLVHSTTVDRFTLEAGEVLVDVPVTYATWGALNDAADNAVVVCHALTGDVRADVWWGPLIGPGRVLDTDRFFVICANVIGSPYGSVSPLSIDGRTGRPFGPGFPDATIRDTVRLHRALLEDWEYGRCSWLSVGPWVECRFSNGHTTPIW
jgi:homoserine O-acetyltransferase/O-succinyltransferase